MNTYLLGSFSEVHQFPFDSNKRRTLSLRILRGGVNAKSPMAESCAGHIYALLFHFT